MILVIRAPGSGQSASEQLTAFAFPKGPCRYMVNTWAVKWFIHLAFSYHNNLCCTPPMIAISGLYERNLRKHGFGSQWYFGVYICTLLVLGRFGFKSRFQVPETMNAAALKAMSAPATWRDGSYLEAHTIPVRNGTTLILGS